MSGVILWLGVGALGGCGSVARYLVDAAVQRRAGGVVFPWGILAVNLSGAFVLGVLAGAALRGDALLLCGGALVGSYTTFSTFMLQTELLARSGHRVLMVVNVLLSLVAGVAAVALGRVLGGL